MQHDVGEVFGHELASGWASRLPASLAARNAARPAARSSPMGGGQKADREEAPHMQHPILTALDGGGETYGGEQLVNDVFDFIRRSLPRLAADDPYRAPLLAMMPVLAEQLGRPLVLPVRASQPEQARQP